MLSLISRPAFGMLLTAGLALLAGTNALAQEARCQHCGHAAECRKVCRLVAKEKKVVITCWGKQDEDFCLPKHGQRGDRHCELVCDEDGESCAPEGVQTGPEKFVWFDWIPNCNANLFTRHELMKEDPGEEDPQLRMGYGGFVRRVRTQLRIG